MHERASMTWGTWQHAHARLLIHLVLLECDTVALRACPRQHCTPGPIVRLLMENASRQQAQEECAHDDGGVGTRANLSMEVKEVEEDARRTHTGRTLSRARKPIPARVTLKSVSNRSHVPRPAPANQIGRNRSQSVAGPKGETPGYDEVPAWLG
jgi:hypothetical protein